MNTKSTDKVGKHSLAGLAASLAMTDANAALDTAISVLRGTVAELERRKAQLNDPTRTLGERAQTMNFALHHLASNVQGNMRLDMLATAQSNLNAAHELRQREEKK